MPYKNKKDQAKAAHRHYIKNKEKIIKRSAVSKKKYIQCLRELVWDYLLQNPCIDCGESDPRVLEFDHLPEFDKKCNISSAVQGARGKKLILDEIKKCEIRCCNCHRKKTAERGNWWWTSLNTRN